MKLSPNAYEVWKRRYAHPTEKIPEDTWHRVAKKVASVEKDGAHTDWEKRFFDMMNELRFLPNSPTIKNAGLSKGTLSACFVLPIEDTIEGILETHRVAGVIEAAGGGIGYGFGDVRPKGSKISSPQAEACGPIAVMQHLSSLGNMITQGFREGAHMGQLPISHPDIREFIHYKDRADVVENFNISVQITDAFMRTVADDGKWQLVSRGHYKGELVSARELWDEICESAWRTGDPGVVFMDRVWETQPHDRWGPIESSNPCGEQFLEPYGNCNLGSINLAKFVSTRQANEIMWDELKTTIRYAVRFLDDVVDVNWFPDPKLEDVGKSMRRIGLGVMGWADMLVMLGIKYDSIEAINLADTMGKLLEVTAWEASAELAVEKGAFPLWTTSRAAKRIEKKHAVPVRNADITTIAPTGTISLLADCSSGIEPHFAREWTRRALWNKGTSTELAESAPDDPNVRTAHEVLPNMHIEMQAAWQKHISNSISKTINMKQDCNVGDVRNAFWHAWKTGCKSVTIYREGSRDIEVLSTGLLEEDVTPILKRPSRPSILEGKTHKLQTADGTLYVIVNVHNEEPFEVFATLGKGGTGVAASLEAISRLISVGLQTGTPLDLIIKQLRGITDNPVGFGGRQIKSVPDAISQVLEKYQPVPKSGGTDKKVLKMGELGSEWKPLSAMPKDPPRGESCPECSGELVMASGCAHCPDCGFERC